MYKKRCPRPEDAAFFFENMKSVDMEKAVIFNDNMSPEVIQDFVDESSYCRVLEADGVPFCIYGVVEDKNNEAWTWACTTKSLYCHSRYFLEVSYEEMAVLKNKYSALYNFGMAKHHKSITWAKRLGYEPKFEREFQGEKFIFMKWEK